MRGGWVVFCWGKSPLSYANDLSLSVYATSVLAAVPDDLERISLQTPRADP